MGKTSILRNIRHNDQFKVKNAQFASFTPVCIRLLRIVTLIEMSTSESTWQNKLLGCCARSEEI